MSIDNVKALIHEDGGAGPPPDRQRLFIELKDGRNLSDYNFQKGGDIFLVTDWVASEEENEEEKEEEKEQETEAGPANKPAAPVKKKTMKATKDKATSSGTTK